MLRIAAAVSLFKHHYSVPKEYVGRRMTILYDADTVEIYCGMNLVATHDRCDIPYMPIERLQPFLV